MKQKYRNFEPKAPRMARYLIKVTLPRCFRKDGAYPITVCYKWEDISDEEIFNDILENFREIFVEEYISGLHHGIIFKIRMDKQSEDEEWSAFADRIEAHLNQNIEKWCGTGFDYFERTIWTAGYIVTPKISSIDEMISLAKEERFEDDD